MTREPVPSYEAQQLQDERNNAWERIKELRAEVERLQLLLEAKTTPGYELLADEAVELRAEIERLKALLGKLRWKSIDKDNMEFRCDITCYVMDEIRAALKDKP
jgi:uncharacterized small protein (DUF1192 family)